MMSKKKFEEEEILILIGLTCLSMAAKVSITSSYAHDLVLREPK